ncbi:MAG: hypothetical protein DWQ47_05000 [Acidobacteria bacterium]|nr:MAG: hypothetical protein DWQ32_08550 [Acidobacteriota bacterium]REK01740.1 MAG: hypothetical protein DWQ38_04985 [Acidobacteriota bacterium]REK14696.1 MAG: hypothetical protein DWQ43_14240 [Acidobacteriota bacterium]REK45411.1 MAG: hypothetical protein DWQ47_05000 [Acidobacteriota bacterium]
MIELPDLLTVLEDFTSRLDRISIDYMLTGSMALVHYAAPRNTADIDLVIDLSDRNFEKFLGEFESDYYIPPTSAKRAVAEKRMFNALNQASIVKVDCAVRKDTEFHREAFSRRKQTSYSGDFDIWIITREDLIISKLLWAKESKSEMQMRDVGNIVRHGYEEGYVHSWCKKLGIDQILKEVLDSFETDET